MDSIAEFVAGYQFDMSDEGGVYTPTHHERVMLEDAICSFLSVDGWRPTHLHVKSGRHYKTLNVVKNATNAQDGQKMVLYCDAGGQWFVREYDEYFDGRFERLPASPGIASQAEEGSE